MGIDATAGNMPDVMRYLRTLGAIVMSGAALLAVVVLTISWIGMTPTERSATYSLVGRSIAWVGVVLVLPWATFFVSTAAARRDSNRAGGVVVAGYAACDIVALLLLFGAHQPTTLQLGLIVLGLLAAVVYNLLACDWIAEKR